MHVVPVLQNIIRYSQYILVKAKILGPTSDPGGMCVQGRDMEVKNFSILEFESHMLLLKHELLFG